MKPVSLSFFLNILLLCILSLNVVGQARLVINGARINITNGANLVIDNPAANAITRIEGYIMSEGENNNVKWDIGTTTGTYTIPWGYSSNYTPLSFTPSGAVGSGYFLFSTYHTNWNNSGLLPTGVANLTSASGSDNSAFDTDRFWKVSPQGYSSVPALAGLTFTYLDVENTTSGNKITESGLKAQRYNSTTNSWNDLSPAGIINTTTNTVSVGSVTSANVFAWWTLTSSGVNRYWVSAAASNWNNVVNWSSTSGGPGGASVPTYVDAVYFNELKGGNCTADVATSMALLDVGGGFSKIISQGSNSMTIGGSATFSGGIFNGGTSAISVAGPFVLSGTSFFSSSTTMDLKDNFTFSNGAFFHNDGLVLFSGTAGVKQNINGPLIADFKNIRVTNTSAPTGVSIEGNENIYGVLTLAGNVHVDVDGNSNSAILKLISVNDNPTQDASVAILPLGAQLLGNLTVQRYMAIEGDNNTGIYRYIASPVQNGTVADIQNEISVTGLFTGASTCSGCFTNATSLFSYAESVITDTNGSGGADFDDGYNAFPLAANSETFVPGTGYALYVRGALLSTAMWDLRGIANQGNVTPITLPVSYTSSGNVLNDGWNLVGNPYPSTIDWNAASGWSKSNLDGSVYYHDNGAIPGRFAVWNGTTGTNGASRYIATGQGFWVKATGGGVPVLQGDENIKTSGQSTEFFREGSLQNLLRITLLQGPVSDETVIHFRADATPQFDGNADAWKLPNANFDVSSNSSQKNKLAINSWSLPDCSTAIDLNIDKTSVGSYELKFTNLDSFDSDITPWLIDKFMKDSVLIRDNFRYAFGVTPAAGSNSVNRFRIHFDKPTPPVIISEDKGQLTVPFKSGIQWYYNSNPIVGENASMLVANLSGTYSVTVQSSGCSLQGSLPFSITGLPEPTPTAISLYPNPTKGHFSVSTNQHLPSATILNLLGEWVGTVVLKNSGDTYTGDFDLQNYPTGIYLVRIAQGDRMVYRKLVKD